MALGYAGPIGSWGGETEPRSKGAPSPPLAGVSPRRSSAFAFSSVSPPPPSAALLALSQGPGPSGAKETEKNRGRAADLVGRAVHGTADVLERCGSCAGTESAAVVRELGEVLGELRQRCIATERRQGTEAAAREQLSLRVRAAESHMESLSRGLMELTKNSKPEDVRSTERSSGAVRRAEQSAVEAQEAERRLQKLLLQTSDERRDLAERLDSICRQVSEAGIRAPTAARNASAEARIAAAEEAARSLLGRVGEVTTALQGVEELRSRLTQLEQSCLQGTEELRSRLNQLEQTNLAIDSGEDQRLQSRLSAVEERLSGVMLSQVDQQAALSARTAALEQRQRSAEERTAAAEQRTQSRAECARGRNAPDG